MAAITVRNLPDETVARLRVRAARRGRSMEADVREALVALGEGARVIPAVVRPSVEERVAKVQAMVRARLGELPKGRVDAFLAERRAAAERGE